VREKSSQIRLFGLSSSRDDFINTSRKKFSGEAEKKSDIYPCVKNIRLRLPPSGQILSERTDITVMLVMYCKKVTGLNLCRATDHKAMFSETGTLKIVLLVMQLLVSNAQIQWGMLERR
jgi:hypothetical protein